MQSIYIYQNNFEKEMNKVGGLMLPYYPISKCTLSPQQSRQCGIDVSGDSLHTIKTVANIIGI